MSQKQIAAENINPYDNNRPKTEQVEEMFDSIAPAYDFMNRAMTLGIDRLWRRRVVKMVAESTPTDVLDVATGTADLAIAIARKCLDAKVTGIDLSEGMLAIGQKKVAEAGLGSRVTLRQADCLALPFADASFDVATVAFGMRNFENLRRGLGEMRRVLRRGGRLIVLELSVPTNPIVKFGYKIYTRGLIPLVGRLISSDKRAYSYLPESIAAMPTASEILTILTEAGFSTPAHLPLTLGVASIYTAQNQTSRP